jgi:predicted GIY-YIG superfamily endonuclease
MKYNGSMNEAILYILYSPIHKAVKIGISDITGKRFASHRTKGWLLVSYWHFFERDQARAVESTETFDATKVTKRGLIRMVNKAIISGKKEGLS